MTSGCLYRKSSALFLLLVALVVFWLGSLAQAAASGAEALLRIDKMVQVKGGLLQKLVDGAPGDIITFILSVSNYGSAKATNISLEDQLPKDLLYLDKSANSLCAVLDSGSSGLKWTIANLEAKATCQVSYQAKVNPDMSSKYCGRELVNMASVRTSSASNSALSESCSSGFSESDCNPTSDRATVRVACSSKEPELKVSKWSEYKGDLKVGSALTYYVEIENIGSTEALGVQMRDALPAGLILQGEPQIKCQSACDAQDPLNVVEANIPSMKPGEICQIWFKVKITGEACGKAIINQASVIAKDLTTPILSKATNDTVYCEKPNLSLSKDAKAEGKLQAGGSILYTLTLKNTSETDLQGIEVTDKLTDSTEMLEVLQAEGLPGNKGSWGWPNSTLTVNFAKIKAGETCTIAFRVKVRAKVKCGDEILNKANARIGDLLNVSSNETRLVVECGAPSLKLDKRSEVLDQSLKSGSWIKYGLTVSNMGDSEAQNVEVNDLLPNLLENYQFIPVQGVMDQSAVPNLKYAIASLGAGESVKVMFKAQVKSSAKCDDVIVNQAFAKAKDVASVGSNSTSDKVACAPPSLELAKTASVDTARVGDSIQYTLTMKYTGTTDLQGIEVTDKLADSTEMLELLKAEGLPGHTGSWSWPNNTLTINFANVRAGETFTIAFRVKVLNKATCGDVIRNTAQAKGTGTNPLEATSNTTEVKVKCDPPRLELHKSADRTSVNQGGTVQYTLVVKNVGGSTAQNLLVADSIMAPTTLDVTSIVISNCGDGCNASADDSTPSMLKVQIRELKAGQTCTIKFTVRVNKQAECGKTVSNTAQVSYDKQTIISVETTSVNILCPPDLCSSTKTVADKNGGRLEPGDVLEYTITVNNASKTTATGVRVTDDMPAFTEGFNLLMPTEGAAFAPAPAGANNTGSLEVKELTVPAQGSVQIRFTVQVKKDAKKGSLIGNTAVIHPALEGGKTCMVSAKTLTVVPKLPPYEIIGAIDLGCDPVGGAINPLTHEAVITTGLINQAVIVDLAAQRVAAYVTMDTPHGVAINERTNQAIISNLWSNTVTILDLAKRAVIKKVRVGSTPRGVAVNSKTNVAVVANNGSNTVSIIDLGEGNLSATIRVGLGPDSVAIDPEMNLAAVSNADEGSVSLVDLKEKKVVKAIAGLNNPLGVAFNTNSDLLYVVNRGNAKLSQIDAFNLQTATVNGDIAVGSRYSMPEQVAVDSDTSRAVVSNFNDHAVVFVDLVTGNLLATVDMLKAGGRGPRGLALDQELGLVMVVHQQSNIVVLVSM